MSTHKSGAPLPEEPYSGKLFVTRTKIKVCKKHKKLAKKWEKVKFVTKTVYGNVFGVPLIGRKKR